MCIFTVIYIKVLNNHLMTVFYELWSIYFVGFQLNQNEEEMDRIRRANDDNDILGRKKYQRNNFS